jgi:hypothetical protein
MPKKMLMTTGHMRPHHHAAAALLTATMITGARMLPKYLVRFGDGRITSCSE